MGWWQQLLFFLGLENLPLQLIPLRRLVRIKSRSRRLWLSLRSAPRTYRTCLSRFPPSRAMHSVEGRNLQGTDGHQRLLGFVPRAPSRRSKYALACALRSADEGLAATATEKDAASKIVLDRGFVSELAVSSLRCFYASLGCRKKPRRFQRLFSRFQRRRPDRCRAVRYSPTNPAPACLASLSNAAYGRYRR
jgi:hypothetical protein